MNIKEKYLSVQLKDSEDLYHFITRFVNNIESGLSKKEILKDIRNRDEMGEGLISSNGLIIHIIDTKISQNRIIYLSLKEKIEYFSKQEKRMFYINTVIVLIINPNFSLTGSNHLKKFLNDKHLIWVFKTLLIKIFRDSRSKVLEE